MTENASKNVSYEQFHDEWLAEIKDQSLSSLQKGRRFAVKLITQWLGVTSEDEDFFVCDGSRDGGIDVAYLQRQDRDYGNQAIDSIEGDTWYLVQSKYGASFLGTESIITDGCKIVETLQGKKLNLSTESQQLLRKIALFREQASDADRIVLVFATCDPITEADRQALWSVKSHAREQGISNFDVEEVSIRTVWDSLSDVDPSRISVKLSGQFIEQYSGLLVGTVSLLDLFEFLRTYQKQSGSLDQLYEKNVRQFLGGRRKINKGIANTLQESPEKFGLYNNGITVVVSGYARDQDRESITMNDPYIVNGCQTTRTIWEVLDSKLNSGGTGTNAANESWKERVRRGGVVAKIVKSDYIELPKITRFTNSQNAVREQDFIALHSGFQGWASDIASRYNIFLEIQRGGIECRKALEKRNPNTKTFAHYANAFELIKVYGAGWIGVPGLAFNKNAPFLPTGSIYQKMVCESNERPFGADDLYAAYILKCAADRIGFGRKAKQASRHLSRYLFYHITMRILENMILLTPELRQPNVSLLALTEAMLKLSKDSAKDAFDILCNSAVGVIDQYFLRANDNSIHSERLLLDVYNGNINGFLKSEDLGKKEASPVLVQLIAMNNSAMNISMGGKSPRECVASALIATI